MDETTATFGMLNFGTLDLGDRRRTGCLVRIADLMCRHPGGTLPDKLNRPADLRAFYRLVNRPEMTHAAVIHSHAERTRAVLAAAGAPVVLLLHDSTELDYTAIGTLAGQLSQIGRGSQRGYICHNSLAVRADSGGVLGLTAQILHRRARVPKKESVKQLRERKDRESRLWVEGARASGPAPAGVLCVDVSDSLSDTFEYMAFEEAQGRHYVLRQREDRRLHEPAGGHKHLEAAVRALPSVARRPLSVQASPGRRARKTTVQVSFTELELGLPDKKHGEYPNEPLTVWAVRVWEEDTPAGEELLEWILLTNVPVRSAADAHARVDWYERRPIIEEYHKGMKTGCRIESMQFDKVERLEPAIAVIAVVTTTLLQLRDAARAPDAAKRPASEVIGADYIAVLVSHYGRRLSAAPSVLQFYLHVARLGGHQNRKVDGLPGWITLWRGWTRLQAMVDGYHAALRRSAKKCGAI